MVQGMKRRLGFAVLSLVSTLGLVGLGNQQSIAEVAPAIRAPSIAMAKRAGPKWEAVPLFSEPSDTASRLGTLGDGVRSAPTGYVFEVQPNGWLHVLVAQRSGPKSSEPLRAWIRASDVEVFPSKYRIEINRKKHRMRIYRNGIVVEVGRVAVGNRSLMTPKAMTFVTNVVKSPGDNGGPLGPFSVELAAWSSVLDTYAVNSFWDGIVLQGTNTPKVLGKDVTHGSIRMTNRNISWIARNVPIGTPVEIQ
jgi:lipoprotein-anchoring transpeptidase ErfK/SrfK